MTERDPYSVLGVPPHADSGAIAAAYRTLARRHHPDVSTHPDAERRMAAINAAWAILRDPVRRAAWDRDRRAGAPAPAGPHAPTPPRPAPAGGGHAAAQARPSSHGSTPAWRRGPNGEGAAGPPPGSPRGSVLPFGRHVGWSLGEIARVDPGYLLWLRDRPEGAPWRTEIDGLLHAMQRPATAGGTPQPPRRRRLFGT